MSERNEHSVGLSTQFWQPWYHDVCVRVCVCVCHTCYRLLIRSEIIYLDVSSATSRGAQPSSRQKRPTAVGCRRAPGGDQIFYAVNLRVFAGNIVTRLRRRRSNYTRGRKTVFAIWQSINSLYGSTRWWNYPSDEKFHRANRIQCFYRESVTRGI